MQKDSILNGLHFDNHPNELRLAGKLSADFEFTNANLLGNYSYWIVKPHSHLKERFGLQNEILCIYSSFKNNDARVLTAIENISRSPDFKHRLDKVLFMFVSTAISAEMYDLLKKDTDRVIVPFLEQEVLDNTSSVYVRNRIAQYFGEIDLFGVSSPITYDQYFFGREKLVQTLSSKLLMHKQNFGLFGLRKTGKTSVLRAIERKMASQEVPYVYVDCHNPGNHSCRWWQLLENVVEKLVSEINQKQKKSIALKPEYSPTTAGMRFVSDIQTILSILSSAHIVLIFDEIEFITPTISGALGIHWDADFVPFWQTIRACHHETSNHLTFIIAGVNPYAVESNTFAGVPNPIFQLALPEFLEPFGRDSVRDMIRTLGRYSGLSFNEDVYRYLSEAFGGHPFLIRTACSQLWKSLASRNSEHLTTIGVEDFEKIGVSIIERLSNPIKDILLSLLWWYPEEFSLLQILADGDEAFVKEYIKDSPGTLLKFVKYGLFRSVENPVFTIESIKSFINEFGDKYKKEISPFTRSDLPMDMLPEVPDLDIMEKLFRLRVDVEVKLRKAVIFYLQVNCNFDNEKISQAMIAGLRKRADRKDPAALLTGNRPQDVIIELYLLDLKEITITNWEIFKGLWDNNKDRFAMNMDTVNLARRFDAHTKPMKDSFIADFENSYGWLNRYLGKLP